MLIKNEKEKVCANSHEPRLLPMMDVSLLIDNTRKTFVTLDSKCKGNDALSKD